MKDVVIPLRDLARMSWWRKHWLSNVRSFNILRGSKKDNIANFSGEKKKKYNEASGVSVSVVLRKREKT